MGINNRHIFALAMAVALAIVAIAGVLMGIRTTFDPTSGSLNLIFAFEAVIMGGMGSLWGTMAGGMLLGLAQTLGAQAFGSRLGHPLRPRRVPDRAGAASSGLLRQDGDGMSAPPFRVARSSRLHSYAAGVRHRRPHPLVLEPTSVAVLPHCGPHRTAARLITFSHAGRAGPAVEPAGRLRRPHLRRPAGVRRHRRLRRVAARRRAAHQPLRLRRPCRIAGRRASRCPWRRCCSACAAATSPSARGWWPRS